LASASPVLVTARGVAKCYRRTVLLAGLDAEIGTGRRACSARAGPGRRRKAWLSADDCGVGQDPDGGAIVSLTQYYTATSLDGYIADPDNSLDWLFTRKRESDGPLNYGEFVAEIGAMAMGSTTYEWILDHEFADKDPAEWRWPYDIPCWVFTHRQLPVVRDAQIEFTSADVAAVHEEMVGASGDRNVWIVGGGDLAGQFADAGLLDEVIVMIAPVTLGGGAPLLSRRIELRLDELGRNGDFACARFSVACTGDASPR
jgi:dihydrofolate reductase